MGCHGRVGGSLPVAVADRHNVTAVEVPANAKNQRRSFRFAASSSSPSSSPSAEALSLRRASSSSPSADSPNPTNQPNAGWLLSSYQQQSLVSTSQRLLLYSSTASSRYLTFHIHQNEDLRQEEVAPHRRLLHLQRTATPALEKRARILRQLSQRSNLPMDSAHVLPCRHAT